MNTIDQIIGYLNQLYGLPAAALVFLSCIAVGYALRFIKAFPNGGIPVAVILWGAIIMTLVADARASNMPLRVWVVRNVLVGLFIGFCSWLFHNMILSKVEDWIAAKWPGANDTTFFQRKPGDAPPTPASDPAPSNSNKP